MCEKVPAPWVTELNEDLQLTISDTREYHELMHMMMPMLHATQHARPTAEDLLSFSLLQRADHKQQHLQAWQCQKPCLQQPGFHS